MRSKQVLIGCFLPLFFSCGEKEGAPITNEKETVNIIVPQFNKDSAFQFIKEQVEIGPRVPNTPAHDSTRSYLVQKLESYGAKIHLQEFQATSFDNTLLHLTNIIGEFYPERPKRILLAAHWDTRPFADKDSVDRMQPIDGANDGASGVGVLLEVARNFAKNPVPGIGLDIIFFDGEDWGTINGESSPPLPSELSSWWCLGSQYWSKNKHRRNYFAYYGILLDMVGAKDAQFHVEGLSNESAPKVVDKVWSTARELGFGNYFIQSVQPAITDDHEFVNKIAKIPMINIVHYDPEHGYFGDYHHSKKDNLDLIDKDALRAVGQTLLQVLYYE